MVIDVIHVLRVAVVKTKDHPPVGANCDRPRAFPITLERMHLEAGHIHIGNDAGRVEPCQNVAQLFNVLSFDAARVAVFKGRYV